MTRSEGSPARSPGLFGRVWEKAWWVVGLLFVGANAWAAHRYGLPSVFRGWAAGFAALGVAILLYGWRARRSAREALSWLPVEARILRSEVRLETSRSHSTIGGRVDYMTSWFPEIEYEYEFQGRRYVSDRILMVRVNLPEHKARELVAAYPAGARVQAWCNPRRPAAALLKPGIAGYETQYRMPFLVGAGFLLMGLIALAVLSRAGG